MDKQKTASGAKMPEAVNQYIIDLKKENPGFGARRISDILKRFFPVRASPSTVAEHCASKSLSQSAKSKR